MKIENKRTKVENYIKEKLHINFKKRMEENRSISEEASYYKIKADSYDKAKTEELLEASISLMLDQEKDDLKQHNEMINKRMHEAINSLYKDKEDYDPKELKERINREVDMIIEDKEPTIKELEEEFGSYGEEEISTVAAAILAYMAWSL